MRPICVIIKAMAHLYLTLACCLLPAAEPEQTNTLRYLRPAGDKFAEESLVLTAAHRNGTIYISRTDRGAEKMTLSLFFDKEGRLTTAQALQETAAGTKDARLEFDGAQAHLKRGDKTESFQVAGDPIVTTAPDWSDIFQLVRRYDKNKQGRQEFPGLWIHPVKPMLRLTFAIERIGGDTIKVGGQPVMLDRYRIRLRSGEYLAWADATGRVYKLTPPGIVLEGHEEATRALVP